MIKNKPIKTDQNKQQISYLICFHNFFVQRCHLGDLTCPTRCSHGLSAWSSQTGFQGRRVRAGNMYRMTQRFCNLKLFNVLNFYQPKSRFKIRISIRIGASQHMQLCVPLILSVTSGLPEVPCFLNIARVYSTWDL